MHSLSLPLERRGPRSSKSASIADSAASCRRLPSGHRHVRTTAYGEDVAKVMITDLWLSGKLPGWDGLYRADGSAWAARIDDSVPNGFVLMEPLDLTAMLRDSPEW